MGEEKIEKSVKETIQKIEKIGKKPVTEKDYIIAVIIIVGIVLVFYLYANFGLKFGFSGKKIAIEIVRIEVQNCEDCFDVGLFAERVKLIENTKTKNEKSLNYDSKEAQELIKRYNVQKVPALFIFSSRIDKIKIPENVFRFAKDVAIFDRPAPYLELSSGKIKGFVKLTEIYDPGCKDCATFSSLEEQLKEVGIKIEKYEKISATKELIDEKNLTILPTLYISKGIEEYWWFFSQIENSLSLNEDDYKFKEKVYPYKEISSGNVKGKVKITYFTDKSCENCFNVTLLKGSFQSLGVYIADERYADASTGEGKSLLDKYNITAIPTVILSKEISDYDNIKNVLETVGTYENGEFVFRRLDVLNVKYRDLKGG